MGNMELNAAKQMAFQEIPSEAVRELLKELDADRDGVVSKADFMLTSKKVLFDPNPPEEVAQFMEAMEAMAASAMPLGAMPPGMAIMQGPPVQIMPQSGGAMIMGSACPAGVVAQHGHAVCQLPGQ